MKLPEVLKTGIINSDWNLICQAYTAITGEPITPPKQETNWADIDIPIADQKPIHVAHTLDKFPDDIKKILQRDTQIDNALADSLVQPDPDLTRRGEDVCSGEDIDPKMKDFVSSAKNPDSPINNNGRAKKQKILKGPRKNLFDDNLDVAADERADLHPQLGVTPKPRTNARKTSNIDVVCSLCNKTESVSPTLSHGYNTDPNHNVYKCNACCSSRRRNE